MTVEDCKLHKADDNYFAHPFVGQEMASQRDLFENSQNDEVDEAIGEADNPEGGQGEGGEDDFGHAEANDYDPKTKHTVKFQDGELSILIKHLESNLANLVGHIRNNEYRRGRREAWRSLVNAIN